MAPSSKRKRPGGSSADNGEGRPSPHRPQNANLALHDRGSEMRDGGRRSSRGGQGGAGRGRGSRNDGRENPNKLNIASTGRSTPTPGPMSPPPPRPSSAAATPMQTPTPTEDALIPFAERVIAPFDYTFLTDERIASWDTARQAVTKLGQQALQDEDTTDLASIYQELIRAILDSRLKPESGGICVKDILGPDTSPADEGATSFDAQTFFLDTFSIILEAEPELPDPNDAKKTIINPNVLPFTLATGISPMILRQKVDGKLLQGIGLTRDTFNRVGVRQATNLLYRQANYNLLREETEGYSKLVTELFTSSETEPPSSEDVEDAFERVKGLIGTFDLDVGRVLDITLDVFAAVLIKHFRFFIKLLRVSSWWPRASEIDGVRHGGLPKWALPSSPGCMPTETDEALSKQQRASRDTLFWQRARKVGLNAFFELGSREVLDEDTKERILSGRGVGEDIEADREWLEQTGTLPPSGNRVAAQLLGFKLRFYTSPARDDDDILPANLIYLTALLIKIGFISLRDLYPHLWPLDEDMPALKTAKEAEIKEKEKLNRPGGGAANALIMAGALTDDSLPHGGRSRDNASSKSDPAAKATGETEDKSKLDEPKDQKVQLLVCLLTIGALPEALFILGRFPWIPEVFPEVLDLINRILHHTIKDVYDQIRPTSATVTESPTRKIPAADQTGMPKGQIRLTQLQSRKQLRWPFPDKYDTNDNLSYRFYWDEWADNVPVCQSVDDLFTLCSTLLNVSGVSIGKDTGLLTKIIRIGLHSLKADDSERNLDRWQDLLKRILLPALSITKANPSIADEIFAMLKHYPVSTRYSMYAEWYQGATSRLPAMKAAFDRARLETLSTMKRISKVNMVSMARQLAKIAYSAPGVVFAIALSQIESYTNLTEVVINCAKHFTSLGYDVLVWTLLTALGGKDRNRKNDENPLLPSAWLQALSRFSGKVYKKYSVMDLSPVLRYINHQVYLGNSTDLVILKELIAQMSGIVPDTDYTDDQIRQMTGGPLLRKLSLIELQDKRYECVNTSIRFMKALTDDGLAGELLIMIAQYKQAAIYKIPDNLAHIKLLATMMDDTQYMLFQYLDLLRSNLSVEEFDKHVPGIPSLLTDYGLNPALAFLIGRASLAHHIAISQRAITNGKKASTEVAPSPSSTIDVEGDVSMIGTDDTDKSTNTSLPQGTVSNEDVIKVDVQTADSIAPSLSVGGYHEQFEPIISALKTALPEDSFKALNPDFYVTFWSSALGDLTVPAAQYTNTAERLKRKQAVSRQDSSLTSAQKQALHKPHADLLVEFSRVVNEFEQKKNDLLKNKFTWFGASVKPDALNEALLEKCLLPRLLLSPVDAEYSFKMIKFMHDNNVPYFRTLGLYSQLFKPNRLRAMIFTCTVREVENLGRFLRLVLTDLARWHGSATVYEREAWGSKSGQSGQPSHPGVLIGFAKALDENGKPKGFLSHDGDKGFKNVLFHWHKSLNLALRDCLEGEEFMHNRNAISILKSVVGVFPAINFQGTRFIELLNVIAIREKGIREDMALLANSVVVMLKKREPKWVMVQAFGHIGASATDAKPTANGTSKSMLKPSAPEFKPGSRASSQGLSKPQTTMEVEDGEVDDAKSSKRNTASTVVADPADRNRDVKRANTPSSAPEPKRSDVLDRREQIKREQAAKASSSPNSSVPTRPDLSRTSTPTSLNDRGPPNLPTRPDAPFPNRDLLDRHPPPRHGERRDGRDGRLLDPRSDRSTTRPGERPREFSGSDRRAVEPAPRDVGRPSDRVSGTDRERVRPDPPPRWTAESARENLERSALARGADNGRLSRDMPPPRISGASSDYPSSDRVPSSAERQEIVNPERAALISGDKDTARSDSPRRGREEPRDRVSSRPQSPRRHGSDREHPDARRDTRNGPQDYSSPRNRAEDTQPPPAGPRSDRPLDRERGGVNDRSAFQPSHPPARPVDPDHGRLTSTSRQPDPNFGRLTAPTPDIPSGPRDRNSRGGRTGNPAPGPPRRDVKPVAEMPRPPTPEKQPPTGPSGRHPRRSASGQFDSVPASSNVVSTPSTPVAAAPSPAIHPDRLKHLPVVQAPAVQPQQIHQGPPPGIHPSRQRAFDDGAPVTPQSNPGMNNNRSMPNVPPLTTPGTPSGPRSSQPSPISAGPNGFAAPTGPASATERAARGGRRQLAGINTMLQQADRTQIRGRGRPISGMGGPETPNSAPTTPAIPIAPPHPTAPPPRLDGGRDATRDLINPARADLITGPAAPTEERGHDRSARRERSSRSRRSSRSPGRERESKRGAPEDEHASRSEYRDRSDRRGGEPEKERHHRGPSPTRELLAGRISTGGSGRESGPERSSRHHGRERDPARDAHEAGWNPGGERGPERSSGGRSRDVRSSGDLRSDERRDSRGTREDGGRKRRSEEGGTDSRGHEKRVRR